MITEGQGNHAPRAVQQHITNPILRQIHILANERAQHRGYSNRPDKWGQGIDDGTSVIGVGVISKDAYPIFVGLIGEWAAQSYTSSRFAGVAAVDTKLNATGDFGVDLKAYGLTVQVKTRKKDSGVSLVKANNVAGRSMVCLFAQWSPEPCGICFLLGWRWTADVVARMPVPSNRGPWRNYEVPDTELLPMCRLLDELEAWKARQKWKGGAA